MALQMVQHKTGETFVVDPETMTTTLPLHHSELDAPLENYQLAHDMESWEPEEWRVLRYGFEPALEQQAAQQEWLEANPECEEPTDDKTDEAIRKVLLDRNIRLGGDWASVSAEEFREAVKDGMDEWWGKFETFWGTDNATYYVDSTGQAWMVQSSVDMTEGQASVKCDLPADAAMLDWGSITDDFLIEEADRIEAR